MIDQAALDACVSSLQNSGEVTGIEVMGRAPGSGESARRSADMRASLVASRLALEFPKTVVNTVVMSAGAPQGTVRVTAFVSWMQNQATTEALPNQPQEQVVILSAPDTSAVQILSTPTDGLFNEDVALGWDPLTTNAAIGSERNPAFRSAANIDSTAY
jgi:hypothetical protein